MHRVLAVHAVAQSPQWALSLVKSNAAQKPIGKQAPPASPCRGAHSYPDPQSAFWRQEKRDLSGSGPKRQAPKRAIATTAVGNRTLISISGLPPGSARRPARAPT